MATTVRFWAAGFFGFIAYGALRCLGATLFASSLRANAKEERIPRRPKQT
jgi:hypothetical protein